MTVFTEGRHAAEFVLSEANGHRSRENGVAGAALVAGTIVQLNQTGNLVGFVGDVDTNDELEAEAVGIVLYNAALNERVSYIARHAEVNGNILTYPEESTAGGEGARAVASLAKLAIIVR